VRPVLLRRAARLRELACRTSPIAFCEARHTQE
jgi:hypothetical protein